MQARGKTCILIFEWTVLADKDSVTSFKRYPHDVLDRRKFRPAGGAMWEVRGSPMSSGFSLSGSWMSEPNSTPIHPADGPKRWTNRSTDQRTSLQSCHWCGLHGFYKTKLGSFRLSRSHVQCLGRHSWIFKWNYLKETTLCMAEFCSWSERRHLCIHTKLDKGQTEEIGGLTPECTTLEYGRRAEG